MDEATKAELWAAMIGWNDLPGVVAFYDSQARNRSQRDREEWFGFVAEVSRLTRWRRVCDLIQEADKMRREKSIEFERAVALLCDLKQGQGWPVRPKDYRQAGTKLREIFGERACGDESILALCPPSKATMNEALRSAFSQAYSQSAGQGQKNQTLCIQNLTTTATSKVPQVI